MTVNDCVRCAILDSGIQVSILFESVYEEDLKHLPLNCLTGLGLSGLSNKQYPYSGYINILIKFPASIAGVEKEISTIALVCPDPGWKKGATIIVGTNFSMFQILA